MPRFAKPMSAPPAKKPASPPIIGRAQPGPLRGARWHAIQLTAARSAAGAPAAKAQSGPGRGGLPAQLKTGVEQLSGIAMDDVRVHRNSGEPAKLGALAYAQGSDIHLGPGQEAHLPHEAWHVVQQKQGRVKPTLQMKGIGINEDNALEREADLFGALASRDPEKAAAAAGPLAAPRATAGVRQLKTLAKPQDLETVAEANAVYFNDGIKQIPEFWQTAVIDQPLRVDLLKAMAERAAALGSTIDTLASSGWNPKRDDSGKQTVARADPVRVRVRGRYAVNQVSKDLHLDYHFGSSWSGYVIRVHDTGRVITKVMRDPASAAPLGQDKYSNKHDINLNQQNTLENRGNNADAVTKIAGEGARWKIIADNAGKVRDDTKFYTNENAQGAINTKVRHVIFPTLWKSWASTFNKTYGTANDVVVTKLKGANFRTGTGENVTNVAVEVEESAQMRPTVDISVDRDRQPTQKADLDPAAVAFIYYKKKSPSVVESQDDLDDEIAAAHAAVGAKAKHEGVEGYLGKETFGFLCSWQLNANLAAVQGYNYQSTADKAFSYPAYRAESLAGLAKRQASGQELGNGDEVFEEERETRYGHELGLAAERLQTWLDENDKGEDLDSAKVVAKQYPRQAGEAIPEMLLGQEWDDDEILKAMATAYEKDLDKRRSKEVDRRLEADPYYKSKNKTGKAEARQKTSAAVKLEIT